MFDDRVPVKPVPDEAPADETPVDAVVPEQAIESAPLVPVSPAISTARGLMPLILIGALTALIALLALQWPTTPPADAGVEYVPHIGRIVRAIEGKSVRGLPGMLVDLSIYGVLLATLVCVLLTLRRGRRDWLGVIVVTGLLGMAYTAGMVLYIGPMVAACGFTLIVFGALVAWIATGDTGDTTADAPREDDSILLPETGKADHDSTITSHTSA